MNPRIFRNSLFGLIYLFLQVCPAIGQDVTSDTTAIRAILQANGISDTVVINESVEPPLPPPRYFVENDRVVTLNMETVGLTTLPSNIGNLNALTHLELNDNSLTTLPPEIGNISFALPGANLSRLILNNNQLTGLPDSIGKLRDLANLNLADNGITELPPSFLNLPLQNLDLENNDLERFPPGITTSMSFGPVGSLNIHGNRLCSLITQGVADWLDSQDGTGGWRQTQRCNVGAVGYAQGPGSPFTVSQNASTLQSEGGVAQWDVSGTQRGVYIVRVREGRDSWERKVVVEP